MFENIKIIAKFKKLKSSLQGKTDLNSYIEAFAEFKEVKPEQMDEFRSRILSGLEQMNLKKDKIEFDEFAKVAEGVYGKPRNEAVQVQAQEGTGGVADNSPKQ